MNTNDTTIRVVKRNGKLFRQWPDGSETRHESPASSEARVQVGDGRSVSPDPDNPPSDQRQGSWRELPRTFAIRRRLKLTRSGFAERFQIPLEVVNDWEDGKSVPDSAADTYLRLIAQDPEAITKLLQRPVAAE